MTPDGYRSLLSRLERCLPDGWELLYTPPEGWRVYGPDGVYYTHPTAEGAIRRFLEGHLMKKEPPPQSF